MPVDVVLLQLRDDYGSAGYGSNGLKLATTDEHGLRSPQNTNRKSNAMIAAVVA